MLAFAGEALNGGPAAAKVIRADIFPIKRIEGGEAEDGEEARPSAGRRILKVLKTVLIAASVAIIVIGVAQTAMEFLFQDAPQTAPGEQIAPPKDQSQSPAEAAPKTQAPATRPSRPMPSRMARIFSPSVHSCTAPPKTVVDAWWPATFRPSIGTELAMA